MVLIRNLIGLSGLAILLVGCAPSLPSQVTKSSLDAAISGAIGDPNTCLMIGKIATGAVVYRFGSHVICGKPWPSCTDNGVTSPSDILKSGPKIRTAATSSCRSSADGSRSVSWASGPVVDHADLAYVAVMEGSSVPPGIVIADKLRSAFKTAGF